MKICPQCETGFHDSTTTCPTHGGLLSEIRDLRPGMLIRDTYRIIRKLGKGGMGAVYLAQHTLIDEPRALKFLSQEMSEDEAFTGRFLREVRMLRQLRNKNVVDCGDPERAEDGSLFFPMEFVDGPDLRSFLKTAPRPFDVRLALEITRAIAEGLGAAHSKGMVHRDVKPDNVLMGRDGAAWVPKIADFGIVATKESSHQTKTGSMLLTMAYAAPEQWIGTRAAELDGRTDIYALGGVLFEMLVGRGVFEAENYHEWSQKHINAVPPTPSSLRPDLAQWKGLDALVLRMLAKDREDRPQNVAELIRLLDAVVCDPDAPNAPAARPVPSRAQPPNPFYPAPRPQWPLSQTPLPPAAPAIQPFVAKPLEDETFIGGPTPGLQSGPYPLQPEAAPRAPVPLAPVRHAPPPSPAPSQPPALPAEPATPAPPVQRVPVEVPAPVVIPPSAPAPAPPPFANRRIGPRIPAGVSRGAPAASEPVARSKGVTALLWVVGLLLVAGGIFAAKTYFASNKVEFATLQSQAQPILSIAISPNGLTLASASRDNTIQMWDLSTAKALNNMHDQVDAIAFSPDGRSLAAADSDKNVKQWDAASGQVLATLDGHTGKVNCVAFSPDGRVLASGSSDTTIRLWDLSAEKVLRVLQGSDGDVNAIAFSPDGRTLASAVADGSIKLFDVASGKIASTLQGHTKAVNTVAYSRDGRILASGSDDTTIVLWDVGTGNAMHTLQGHTGPVRSVAFTPNGRTLASGSADTTVKLWDVTDAPQAIATLKGHKAAVNSVAFDATGGILASGSSDNSIRLWYMPTVRN